MKTNFRFKQSEIGVFAEESADMATEDFSSGCHIIGMTMGQFSLIDMVHSILKKTGPADLYIATWSAGIKDAHQVRWMLDTHLITGIRLLTDHSYVNRQKKYAVAIEDLFGPENIRTSEMHAKFVVIKNDDFDVVILSSMNLNANKTCEVFTIHEDPEIAGFFLEFMGGHFERLHDGWEKSSAAVNDCVQSVLSSMDKKPATAPNWWSES